MLLTLGEGNPLVTGGSPHKGTELWIFEIFFIVSLISPLTISDGKILVVGGMGLDTNPKDYLMSYDVENDRWQSLTPMPTPRYATFSFLINDKLYVLGELLSLPSRTWVPMIDLLCHINGLVQERCNSSALAMDLRFSCTN